MDRNVHSLIITNATNSLPPSNMYLQDQQVLKMDFI